MLQTIWLHCQCWNSRWVFALCIGDALQEFCFCSQGFCLWGTSNSSFVSSYAHPHLCAAVWALELLKRAPSHQFSNWDMGTNLGYEGKRVFVLREISWGGRCCAGDSQEQSGLKVGKAFSPLLGKKDQFFHLWADESLCTVSHEIQSRVISFQVFSKEHDVFWELYVWMLPSWRSVVTRKVERKGQQPY